MIYPEKFKYYNIHWLHNKNSESGNWTRVTCVTGRYTDHYTNSDFYVILGGYLEMYMLEKPETEEELKKIALEKGLIFTRSKMGIDDENSVTILHGAYGKSGMTVQGFIHS